MGLKGFGTHTRTNQAKHVVRCLSGERLRGDRPLIHGTLELDNPQKYVGLLATEVRFRDSGGLSSYTSTRSNWYIGSQGQHVAAPSSEIVTGFRV